MVSGPGAPRGCPHPLLELCPLLQGERVGLGDHRHHVDDLAEPPHELQVEGPQPERDGPSPCCPPPGSTHGCQGGWYSPVARGGDKVHATMDPGVRDLPLTGDEDLLAQVPLVLLVDVLDDGVPAGDAGMASERPTGGVGGHPLPKCCHLPPPRSCTLPVLVVDLVPEARRVRHRQLHLHTLLLDDYGAGGVRGLRAPRRLPLLLPGV